MIGRQSVRQRNDTSQGTTFAIERLFLGLSRPGNFSNLSTSKEISEQKGNMASLYNTSVAGHVTHHHSQVTRLAVQNPCGLCGPCAVQCAHCAPLCAPSADLCALCAPCAPACAGMCALDSKSSAKRVVQPSALCAPLLAGTRFSQVLPIPVTIGRIRP